MTKFAGIYVLAIVWREQWIPTTFEKAILIWVSFFFFIGKEHEPKRARTKKNTNQKGHEPKRAQTKMSTNQKEHEANRARTNIPFIVEASVNFICRSLMCVLIIQFGLKLKQHNRNEIEPH